MADLKDLFKRIFKISLLVFLLSFIYGNIDRGFGLNSSRRHLVFLEVLQWVSLAIVVSYLFYRSLSGYRSMLGDRKAWRDLLVILLATLALIFIYNLIFNRGILFRVEFIKSSIKIISFIAITFGYLYDEFLKDQ